MMGDYTRNLGKRLKKTKINLTGKVSVVAVAIIRKGEVHSYGYTSHAALRQHLGDHSIYETQRGDTDGFLLSDGSFANREAAAGIAYEAGQIPRLKSQLLSSDLTLRRLQS